MDKGHCSKWGFWNDLSGKFTFYQKRGDLHVISSYIVIKQVVKAFVRVSSPSTGWSKIVMAQTRGKLKMAKDFINKKNGPFAPAGWNTC